MDFENQNEPQVEYEKVPETGLPKRDTSIIKQLNDKNIYPTHERIGIYAIAALSIFGILLIAYTGVRLLFVSTGVASQAEYTPTTTVPSIPEESPDTQPDSDVGEVNDENGEERGPQAPPAPGVSAAPQTGITNGPGVNIRDTPSLDSDSMVVEQIGEGVELTILNYNYSEEWAQISFNGEVAYVYRGFIDIEE